MNKFIEFLEENNIQCTDLRSDNDGITYEFERKLKENVYMRDYIKCEDIYKLDDNSIDLLIRRLKVMLKL